MNKVLSYPVFILVILLSVNSCYVKEDRSECPCIVSVKTQADTNCVVSFYDLGFFDQRKAIGADNLRTGENWTSVRRGLTTVSAVCHCEAMEFTDSSVCCRSGEQFSEMTAFSQTVVTDCEEVLVEDVLLKQYCKVTLEVRNPQGGEYPYKALFKAPSNGMLLKTLQPVYGGQFIYEPLFDEQNVCTVRLPRQKDNEGLRLELSRREGGLIGKINLGKYFLAAAYDWEADSLEDINIVIDYALSTVTVRVNDWKQVCILQYEI